MIIILKPKEDNASIMADLIISNNKLIFEVEEKARRTADLIIADKIFFQAKEKAKRSGEFIVVNLQKKELEKMNSFMIGRELKMMELKKEIKELQKNLENCKILLEGKNK